MSLSPACIFRRGDSPVVAAAIHNGHDTRPSVEWRLAIDEHCRLREEDPFTAEWTQITATQIVGLRSRFEVDLNRPRERAVYQAPEDAWGIKVWKSPPESQLIAESLWEYDLFYSTIKDLLRELVKKHGRVAVFDLHTYNFRRNGPDSQPAASHQDPEINIGTGSMDRDYWGALVDQFIDDLRDFDFNGRSLDVRENVKFQGGYFPRWIHEAFPYSVCAIAVEVKKFFMDEWTGEADLEEIERVYRALKSAVRGVRSSLERMKRGQIVA